MVTMLFPLGHKLCLFSAALCMQYDVTQWACSSLVERCNCWMSRCSRNRQCREIRLRLRRFRRRWIFQRRLLGHRREFRNRPELWRVARNARRWTYTALYSWTAIRTQTYGTYVRLRSSTDRTLTVPRTHHRFGNRSFAVAGPRLWNSLPISLRQISSFGQFRRYLKNHLFGIWEITAQCDVWFSALYKYSYLLTYSICSRGFTHSVDCRLCLLRLLVAAIGQSLSSLFLAPKQHLLPLLSL